MAIKEGGQRRTRSEEQTERGGTKKKKGGVDRLDDRRVAPSSPLTQLSCPPWIGPAGLAGVVGAPCAPTPSSSGPTGAASLSSPLRSVAGGTRELRPSSASSLELGRVFASAPPRLPPSLLAGRRSCPLRLSCPSPSLSSRVASGGAGPQRAPRRLGLPAAPRHPSSVMVLP